MNKTVVVVARQWKAAEITINVTDESIGVSTPLPNFLDALCAEIGSPAAILTQSGLRARLEHAAGAVLQKMKRETARVM